MKDLQTIYTIMGATLVVLGWIFLTLAWLQILDIYALIISAILFPIAIACFFASGIHAHIEQIITRTTK